jgi:hypothetical protein
MFKGALRIAPSPRQYALRVTPVNEPKTRYGLIPEYSWEK